VGHHRFELTQPIVGVHAAETVFIDSIKKIRKLGRRGFANAIRRRSESQVVDLCNGVETRPGGIIAAVPVLVLFDCALLAAPKQQIVETREDLAQADVVLAGDPESITEVTPPSPDPKQPIAVVLVGRHRGVSMHTLLWVQRLFPHYKNFIFLAVGEGA